jgi:hypothetical protein
VGLTHVTLPRDSFLRTLHLLTESVLSSEGNQLGMTGSVPWPYFFNVVIFDYVDTSDRPVGLGPRVQRLCAPMS